MKFIKTYRMNLRRTYARIIVKGETGNEVVYDFTNGNPAGSIPAKCILRGEYEQNLLESSDFVKNKIVSLEKVEKIYEDSDLQPAKTEAEPKSAVSVDSRAQHISTVQEAINYCAEVWGEVVKNSKQAKECALAHGSDFPSLKVKN